MASKRRRKVPDMNENRPQKDRISMNRKAQLQEQQAREADMETRSVYNTPKRITIICSNCHNRAEYELDNRVPIRECINCHTRLVINGTGYPQVVSR